MSRKKDPCQKQACEIQKCLKGIDLITANILFKKRRKNVGRRMISVKDLKLSFVGNLHLENKYMESRCEDVIGEMRRCCRQHAAEKSVCCSGFRKERKTAENNEVLSSSYPASACL